MFHFVAGGAVRAEGLVPRWEPDSMFESKVVANVAVATTALKMVGMEAPDTRL